MLNVETVCTSTHASNKIAMEEKNEVERSMVLSDHADD